MKMASNRHAWLALLAVVTVPLLGGARECNPEPEPPGCVCADIYAPVCGVDGVTYGNRCEADCAGVPIAHEGECRPEPQLCFGDDECGAGERCNHDECHSGCPAGEVCPAVCYGICEPEPPRPGCWTDDQCGAGAHCVFDGCPECPEGMACPAIACEGVCEPDPEPWCFTDEDCGAGEICLYDMDPHCPEGEPCAYWAPATGICVPVPGPSECRSDADCGPDEECAFDAGEPCPPGAMCEVPGGPMSGVCVPRHEPGGCVSDGDCAPGDYCHHEICDETGAPGDGVCLPRMACLPVACEIYCEYGHELDAHGCPLCSCAPPPSDPPPGMCPPLACDIDCVLARDPSGCEICECAAR